VHNIYIGKDHNPVTVGLIMEKDLDSTGSSLKLHPDKKGSEVFLKQIC